MSCTISTTTISAVLSIKKENGLLSQESRQKIEGGFTVTLEQDVPRKQADQVTEIAKRALDNLQNFKIESDTTLQFPELVFVANFGLYPSLQSAFSIFSEKEDKLYEDHAQPRQEKTPFVVSKCRTAVALTIQQTEDLKQLLSPEGQAEWPKTSEEAVERYIAFKTSYLEALFQNMCHMERSYEQGIFPLWNLETYNRFLEDPPHMDTVLPLIGVIQSVRSSL